MSTPEKFLMVFVVLLLGGVGYFGYVSLFSADEPRAHTVEPAPVANTNPTPDQPVELPPGPGNSGTRTEVTATPEVNGEQVQTAPTNGPSGGLRGRVLDPSDQPIKDAVVRVFRGPAAFPIPTARTWIDNVQATTDAEGAYMIDGLTPGEDYGVVAEHTKYAPGEAAPLQVVAKDSREVATIKLKPAMVVHGKVTDQGNTALKGVSIAIFDQTKSIAVQFGKQPEKKPFKTITTDDQGEYRFESLTFKNFEVQASLEGYETQVKSNTSFLEDVSDKEVNFELGRGLSIRGIVRSEDNQPLDGVKVTANLYGTKFQSGNSGKTDASGRFALDGLADGFYMIRAAKEGFSEEIRQREKAGTTDLQIMMAPQGSIEGRVVDDATGTPIGNYLIVVKKFREGQAPTGTHATRRVTNSSGTFTVGSLDPDVYSLFIVAERYAVGQSKSIQVARRETVKDIEIRLDQGGSVSGKVTDSHGKAIENAKVKLNANNFRSNPLLEMFQNLARDLASPDRTTTTNAQGEFLLEFIAPGTYQVEVDHAEYSKKAVDDIEIVRKQIATAGTIALDSGGMVTGTVFGEDGKPLSGATVQASTEQGFLKPARADEQGTFLIRNLPAGKYNLTIQDWNAAGTNNSNPLVKLVIAKNSTVEVFVQEGGTIRQDLHLRRN
ncbi:MAG: carboxypeptidase-like regulatory domain-containing protein [Planctomycetota bacterium]